MKGIFDAYVLEPFGKNFIFELVTLVRTRDFTVFIMNSRGFVIPVKSLVTNSILESVTRTNHLRP